MAATLEGASEDAASEGTVAPFTTQGQEAHPSGGSRRRRRRGSAVGNGRGVHEQANAESGEVSDEAAAEVEPVTPPVTEEVRAGPVARPRRPRRRREQLPASEVVDDVEAEVQTAAAPEPVVEEVPPAKPKRTRKKVAEPAPLADRVPLAESVPVPVSEAATVEVVEVVETKPAAARERRRPSSQRSRALMEIAEVVEIKPARCTRARKGPAAASSS